MWLPFAEWIRTEHPDDVLVMYTDSSQGWGATTDEALRLWEQRTADYVQFALSSAASYPTEVAAICATQAEAMAALVAPSEDALDQVAAWNTAVAAILRQSRRSLNALDIPPVVDAMPYSNYGGTLSILASNLDDRAEAASAGDSTRLAELEAAYLETRAGMSSGPSGSGLEECLASLPT